MSRGELSPESYASLALEVATEASQLLLAGYRKRPTPTEKARRDLVTEFDLKSEALIVARLSAATPELGLIAEESGGRKKPLSWFCDPLDGTTNFVHGHPFWAVEHWPARPRSTGRGRGGGAGVGPKLAGFRGRTGEKSR